MCRLDLCMTLVCLLEQLEVTLQVHQDVLHAGQLDYSRNHHQLDVLVVVESLTCEA